MRYITTYIATAAKWGCAAVRLHRRTDKGALRLIASFSSRIQPRLEMRRSEGVVKSSATREMSGQTTLYMREAGERYSG